MISTSVNSLHHMHSCHSNFPYQSVLLVSNSLQQHAVHHVTDDKSVVKHSLESLFSQVWQHASDRSKRCGDIKARIWVQTVTLEPLKRADEKDV